MNPRLLYIPNLHIDTNLINTRQKLLAVNQLEKWYEDRVIIINLSSTSRNEALNGNYVPRIRKVNKQIYTTTPPVEPSDPNFSKVERALFSDGARDNNQRNDVRIVCDAIKYQAILVTNDGGSKKQPGGIIGNREKLKKLIEYIFTPDEAVTYIRKKIKERDERNIQFAKKFGEELPSWTGKD